jgi:type VI secretion system protein ImpE
MSAEEALKAGDLDVALADLTERVKRSPADARLRISLFQLLAVLGQWQRALTQLNVAGELDAGALAMVSTYRDALSCEALRGRVFSGDRNPLILGEPADWVALILEALRLAAQGRMEQSQTLREQAFEAAPSSSGTIDGAPFRWIADGDTRLGPMLEAVVNGRYYWVPFDQIRSLSLEEPVDLRDLVWAPAHLRLINGGDLVALIPARYPGSESSRDPRIRLARLTEWVDQGNGLFTGLGQRMLSTDAGEYPLLGVRQIELTAATTAGT